MTIAAPELKTYRPHSNIQTSITIKKEHEQKYKSLRTLLYERRESLGDYLISAFEELDQQYFTVGNTDVHTPNTPFRNNLLMTIQISNSKLEQEVEKARRKLDAAGISQTKIEFAKSAIQKYINDLYSKGTIKK